MGADLIGYTVFGPTTLRINARKKRAIVQKIEAILKLLDEMDAMTEEELRPALDSLGMFDRDDSPSLPAYMNPAKFVDTFIEFWNETHSRDTVIRHLPVSVDPKGKYKVVFAGDTSWGDAPDGYGYTMLDTASRFNLFHDFGLE